MVKLFDYQLDAIKHLRTGSILCGGVGSGKSITSVAYFFIQNGGKIDDTGVLHPCKISRPLLIITTARKRDTGEWGLEIARFGMAEKIELSTAGNKVIIDSWNNIHKYDSIENWFIIFDEQRVVGSGSWVKSFLKMAKKNDWILLSATPGDTWSDYIPVFIANGFYKNRSQFQREHIVYSPFCTNFPKIDRYVNTGRLIRLRKSILVNMDYKRKTESVHKVVNVSYNKYAYNELMKTRFDLEKMEPLQNATELCLALRKIVNSDYTRLEATMDIAFEKKRVIIFYNFDYELNLIKNLPWPSDYVIAEWNGHKHQELPDSEKWVFLVQYNAGAEGWNCITTDTIIFYSQTYSYRMLTQAAGRIDRLNTPFSILYYYHLRSNSKIDLAIAIAQKEKKDFNAQAFVSGG